MIKMIKRNSIVQIEQKEVSRYINLGYLMLETIKEPKKQIKKAPVEANKEFEEAVEEAKALGIKVHPLTKLPKLKEKIAKAKEAI